jgi:hypothetical protein
VRVACRAYIARVHHRDRADRSSPAPVAIELPIEIRAGDVAFAGRTRELTAQSLTVAAVRVPGGIAVGRAVSFSVLLQHAAADGPARLDGSAVVVRVDAEGDQVILALQAEWLMTSLVPGSTT